MSRTCASSRRCVSRRYVTIAPAADVAAGAASRPWPDERRDAKLLAEDRLGVRPLEVPGLDARHSGAATGWGGTRLLRRLPRPALPSGAARPARPPPRTRRLRPWNSVAANSPVERSSSESPQAVPGGHGRRHRHQERRFARVEIRRVGERARRDHARHFPLDDALGFARDLRLGRRWRRGIRA